MPTIVVEKPRRANKAPAVQLPLSVPRILEFDVIIIPAVAAIGPAMHIIAPVVFVFLAFKRNKFNFGCAFPIIFEVPFLKLYFNGSMQLY